MEVSGFSCILRQAFLSLLISFTCYIEFVECYRRRHGNSHSSNGALQDWEWWEITLLAVGLVLTAATVWILGQLFCSTKCQERCISKHCCGGDGREEEV